MYPFSNNLPPLFLLLLLSLPLLPLQAQPPPPRPSPSSLCKFTLYPKLCRSMLSVISSTPSSSSDPYTAGKFSVKQSLKQAKKLLKVFDDFLRSNRHAQSSPEVRALDDCLDLSLLNLEYLESVADDLQAATTASTELTDRVESYLSAVATNHYTCYDGLAAVNSNIGKVIGVALRNVTEMYSVSLGLVSEALNQNVKSKFKTRKHGLPSQSYKVRQPLQKLIQVLHEKYRCNKASSSSTSNCRSRSERIIERESESKGILLNNYAIVSHYGNDNFSSIGEAIDAAPTNLKPEDGYFLIYVRQGYYEEYVVVPKHKKNILLIGDGINQTIITGNHSVVDGWTTFNSSTFAVSGERFIAVDITFKNTAGPEKHQAVAVRNNADLSTFYRCSFEGYQDTLYAHSLRQFYRECEIYGTVDFIFGNAAVVFQNCKIYARKPLPFQKNAVTAQGRTDPNQNTGISIQNCTIEAAQDLASDMIMNTTNTNTTTNSSSVLTYLGRPWKLYSRTVFMESYIGDVIEPSGWLEWNGTVGLDTLFFGEFNNYGPRAGTGNRVQWPGFNLLNSTQALNFTVLNFTLGDTWLPDTDIPYAAGLLGK